MATLLSSPTSSHSQFFFLLVWFPSFVLHNDAMKGGKRREVRKYYNSRSARQTHEKIFVLRGGGGGRQPSSMHHHFLLPNKNPFVTVQLYDGARTIVCCCLHFAIQSSVPLEIKCCLLFAKVNAHRVLRATPFSFFAAKPTTTIVEKCFITTGWCKSTKCHARLKKGKRGLPPPFFTF